MIKTKNLSKVFTTEEVETTALNNVNAEVQPGEFVAIMGPSGCGKSTFLHIAGMLDNPTDGEYFFMGEEVSRYSERKRAGLRKGNIGLSAFILAALIVLVIALLTVSYQAIKAARANPVDALRYE